MASSPREIRIVLIALYQCNSFGIRVISDVLKIHNHKIYNIFFKQNECDQMKLPTEHEKYLLVNLIKDINPDLIGISTRSTFFPVARDITLRLKAGINVPVIWGGAHPTICPEESIEFADMICVGEGEESMVKLASKMSNRQEITGIEGLWIKKGDFIEKNNCRPLLDDLDSLPLPSFENKDCYTIENNSLYKGDLYYNDNLTNYLFMSARGCPFNCSFCSNSILRDIFKGKGPFIRQRSVGNVIKELVLAKKRFKKMRFIATNDEVFCLNKEWIKEFASKYKNEIGLPLHCDIHPNYVDEETIRFLRNAGLRTISVGIQSGSERTRTQFYGRNTPDMELKNMAGIFKKYKIFPSYDLIFDNPLETPEDVKTTLNFMLSLPRPYRINMYSLQYHPKTKLTKWLLSEKLISPGDIDGVSYKGFEQWHVKYNDVEEKKELTFLYKLFLLLSSVVNFSKNDPSKVISIFPRWFIRFLQKNKCFKRYHIFTDWILLFPKLTSGLSLLCQGRFLRVWRVCLESCLIILSPAPYTKNESGK